MLWPGIEAEATLETIVVVARCQDRFLQIPCQTVSQVILYRMTFDISSFMRKEGAGRAGAWAASSRTAVSLLSL